MMSSLSRIILSLSSSFLIIFCICSAHSHSNVTDIRTAQIHLSEELQQEQMRNFFLPSIRSRSKPYHTVKRGILNVFSATSLVETAVPLILDSIMSFRNFISSNFASDQDLLFIYEILTEKLNQIEESNAETQKSLRSLVFGVQPMIHWEIALNTFEEYTKPINILFQKFSYYQKHKMKVENYTLIDFANSVLSHNMNSLLGLMSKLNSLVIPDVSLENVSENPLTMPSVVKLLKAKGRNGSFISNIIITSQQINYIRYNRKSIFHILDSAIANNYEPCKYTESPQQLIFSFYVLIALTFARAYTMVDFSYNILKLHNYGNFLIERKYLEEMYLRYNRYLQEKSYNVLKGASTSHRTCDPSVHIENKTYVMVTQLLQGYIENEVNINEYQSCKKTCEDYQKTKYDGCYYPNSELCGRQRQCSGNVYSCYKIVEKEICLSSLPHRRYDWVGEKNKIIESSERNCLNKTKAESWNRFPYICSYCYCLCDDVSSPTSDRFISSRAAVSDIDNGMIVTGIRFRKKNRILYIQIQEGLAAPRGEVEKNSTRWVELNVTELRQSTYLNSKNTDYITLSYETRRINFDRLEAQDDHVITGARFSLRGNGISLEVRLTPINSTTGVMNQSQSFWIRNEDVSEQKEIILSNPGDPTLSDSSSYEIGSDSNTFIKLQPTSKSKDLGQLTVPFFDIQDLVPHPFAWIQSIELRFRAKIGSGGFIGFKIDSYDLSKHLNFNI